MRYKLSLGDCLDVLRGMPDVSVDAVVTDPPAGISFMGREWDSDKGGRDAWIAWLRDVMVECLRVLKPGGYALVWALPRTSHWTAMAVEDAGFEIRDVVTHLFGTGFPKSLDVSKAIDKAAGAKREVVRVPSVKARNPKVTGGGRDGTAGGTRPWIERAMERGYHERAGDTPATDDAARWQGWGTALKPASEHWILARKPLDGTVAANVLEYGTGALNIDGCRIGYTDAKDYEKLAAGVRAIKNRGGSMENSWKNASDLSGANDAHTAGRWPANVTLDEEAAAMLDEQSGERASGWKVGGRYARGHGVHGGGQRIDGSACYADVGGASRFFYVAKAPKKDKTANGTVENTHPTVKNTALMRWLVRLITPPGGTVLDPFMGSGSTGVACIEEGFSFVGVEQDKGFFKTARKRIKYAWKRRKKRRK